MQFKKEYTISIYLDNRRNHSDDKHPVKLRIYAHRLKRTKYYTLKFKFSDDEFHNIWKLKKTKAQYKDIKLDLQRIENKANEVAKQITPFQFEKFEKRLYLKEGQSEDLIFQYNEVINKNNANGQIGNASNYHSSLKSLLAFYAYKTGNTPSTLKFNEVTPDVLNEYENYMINTLGRSRTTVSIYLRAMRAVFNKAISERDIPDEIYPFGKNKYQIPAQKKVKKALSSNDLKKLFDAKPSNHEQKKARDYWFFSFSCNGMNIKDMALLKNKDIDDDKLVYYRAKTINIAKSDLRPISIYLNEYSMNFIDKYRNAAQSGPNDFVFPIINHKMTQIEQHNKTKNFTKFINQHLKKLAKSLDITESISTYWARHTFSTRAIQNGASIEFVSEALNHSNIKTTQNYIAGFDDKVKREFSNNLMNF